MELDQVYEVIASKSESGHLTTITVLHMTLHIQIVLVVKTKEVFSSSNQKSTWLAVLYSSCQIWLFITLTTEHAHEH